MNAEHKRWVKQFLIEQLDRDLDDLRFRLSNRAIGYGVDEFEAMEEYEYQVERVVKFLACL